MVFSVYVRGAEIKRESTFGADKGTDWRQSGPVSQCSSIGGDLSGWVNRHRRVRCGRVWGPAAPLSNRTPVPWAGSRYPTGWLSLARDGGPRGAGCGGTCHAFLRVAYCEFLSN